MFFVKAHSETSIIYHDSRMTQRESQLVGKVVQPLYSALNIYNNHAYQSGFMTLPPAPLLE
jgi:predicted permease